MFSRSAAFYDLIYAGKDYTGEAERVHAWIQAHKRSPGDTLLDVGCGTGRHLSFLRTHYRAEGLDLDPELLAIARREIPEIAFHAGDMTDVRLGRRFDAITCLFSAIGYVRTPERLRKSVRNLTDHLEPGGVLVVEPWLTPEHYEPERVRVDLLDGPDLKGARVQRSVREGDVSVLEFAYLLGTPAGIEHFNERHELGLFTRAQMLDAFRACDLEIQYDPEGLTGRGLYIGVAPLA